MSAKWTTEELEDLAYKRELMPDPQEPGTSAPVPVLRELYQYAAMVGDVPGAREG